MFAELVELGKRVRKGHDALKEEKCSWDIVIDKEGNFLNLIPCDITILTSSLTKYVFYNWLINNILYLCVT